MSRTRQWRWGPAGAALLVATAASSGCAAGGGDASFDEARRAAIVDSVRTTLDEFVDAVEAGDWTGLASFYADDPRFRWLEDGRVAYDSHAAVVESLAGVGASFSHGTLEYSDVRITPLAPGLAALTAGFRQTLVGSDGGGFSFSGVLGATLVHTADGWRFLSGHTSTAR